MPRELRQVHTICPKRPGQADRAAPKEKKHPHEPYLAIWEVEEERFCQPFPPFASKIITLNVPAPATEIITLNAPAPETGATSPLSHSGQPTVLPALATEKKPWKPASTPAQLQIRQKVPKIQPGTACILLYCMFKNITKPMSASPLGRCGRSPNSSVLPLRVSLWLLGEKRSQRKIWDSCGGGERRRKDHSHLWCFGLFSFQKINKKPKTPKSDRLVISSAPRSIPPLSWGRVSL